MQRQQAMEEEEIRQVSMNSRGRERDGGHEAAEAMEEDEKRQVSLDQ